MRGHSRDSVGYVENVVAGGGLDAVHEFYHQSTLNTLRSLGGRRGELCGFALSVCCLLFGVGVWLLEREGRRKRNEGQKERQEKRRSETEKSEIASLNRRPSWLLMDLWQWSDRVVDGGEGRDVGGRGMSEGREGMQDK